jgi:hypothetical protein
MQFKYGNIFRQVLKFDRTDFCKIVKQYQTSDNVLAKQMYVLAEAACPGALHECPYTVRKLRRH